jgi:hypothetical protein
MSEINQDQQPQETETTQDPILEMQGGLTPEEEQALEAEREAAWEARLAPFRNVKKRLTDVEDVVTAIAEVIL